MRRFLVPLLAAGFIPGLLAAGATPVATDVQVYRATSAKEMTALSARPPDMAFSGKNIVGDDGSQTFLVFRSNSGVGLQVREASCSSEGRVVLGAELEKARVSAREGFVLRGEISEGCPTRSICVIGTDACWEPFESGEDGSLQLKAPFRPWNEVAGVHLLISDRDPQGTNVRESPGGPVSAVIAQAKRGDPDDKLQGRMVFAMEQSGKWVRVSYASGKIGWMHATVLGSCAPLEGVMLRDDPNPGAKGIQLPGGARLRLLTLRDGWAQVRAPQGQEGWLRYSDLFSNPYSNCWH